MPFWRNKLKTRIFNKKVRIDLLWSKVYNCHVDFWIASFEKVSYVACISELLETDKFETFLNVCIYITMAQITGPYSYILAFINSICYAF